MIGQSLGHFRILEKLGAGGMGEVYRARDERLDRDVAIKVLPIGGPADDVARKRFRKEALALSKLNHPNIATIFDFNTLEGTDFLVMELVEGEPVAARIGGRALSEKEVANFGAQIAGALEEAHEHGVVHRDLKPSNILITPKGQVKVLDFGLAKLLRSPAEGDLTASLTTTPAAAGTLPYMAPEQLQGEEADARSDIYSLGAVFYEMATGQRAFREELSTRLTDAILHRPPVSPRALQDRISPELERIILKCLEKDPARRYQSAREVGVDLQRLANPSTVSAALPAAEVPASRPHRWGTPAAFAIGLLAVVLLGGLIIGLNLDRIRSRRGAAASSPIESLAVLPLENMSRDPDQDYFADGMTEELITDLAKIGALRVISRTSVMQYKGTRKPLPEIGRELHVDAVVEGSVQRSGDRVRITAQLIEAATDRHLWAESYERDLRDILALQGEVARAIAREINAKLSAQETASLARSRPVNPEAHELYLRGRFYWNKRSKEGLLKSRDLFQQSIQKDPTNALAYASLAESYDLLASYEVLPAAQAYADAKTQAAKALELDNSLGEAHAALGFARWVLDNDVPAAASEFRRAIELDPSNATAHLWYSNLLSVEGRKEEGFEEIRRAHQVDPLSPIINFGMGARYYYARQNDKAIAQFRKTIELDPDFFQAHSGLAQAYEQSGKYLEAIAEHEKTQTLLGTVPQEAARRSSELRNAYSESGAKGYWLERLRLAKADLPRKAAEPFDIALLYGRLGDRDRTLEWLQKQADTNPRLLLYALDNPALDILRSDPRFIDLQRRLTPQR